MGLKITAKFCQVDGPIVGALFVREVEKERENYLVDFVLRLYQHSFISLGVGVVEEEMLLQLTDDNKFKRSVSSQLIIEYSIHSKHNLRSSYTLEYLSESYF